MSTDDMCIDYKRKFGIKFDKLNKGNCQLGLFISRQSYSTYIGELYENYLYLCFFKWNIAIGWFLERVMSK